jgi:hypothetical protein
MIIVTRVGEGGPLVFEVVIDEGKSRSRHRVTMAARAVIKDYSPERVVEAAFRFLLDHEPKESILSNFDIGVIARYFPEFERELPRYLADG